MAQAAENPLPANPSASGIASAVTRHNSARATNYAAHSQPSARRANSRAISASANSAF